MDSLINYFNAREIKRLAFYEVCKLVNGERLRDACKNWLKLSKRDARNLFEICCARKFPPSKEANFIWFTVKNISKMNKFK